MKHDNRMMNDATSNVKVNKMQLGLGNRLSRCISLNLQDHLHPLWRRSTPPSPLLPSDLKISTLLAHRWGASFRLRKAWQWLKWHTCDRSWIHVEYFHAMRIANFAFPALDLCFLDMITYFSTGDQLHRHIFPSVLHVAQHFFNAGGRLSGVRRNAKSTGLSCAGTLWICSSSGCRGYWWFGADSLGSHQTTLMVVLQARQQAVWNWIKSEDGIEKECGHLFLGSWTLIILMPPFVGSQLAVAVQPWHKSGAYDVWKAETWRYWHGQTCMHYPAGSTCFTTNFSDNYHHQLPQMPHFWGL